MSLYITSARYMFYEWINTWMNRWKEWMNYTYSNSIAFSITLKQRLKNCILVVVSVSSFYTFSICLWQNYLRCLNSKLMCRQIIIGTYHVLGISDIHVRKKEPPQRVHFLLGVWRTQTRNTTIEEWMWSLQLLVIYEKNKMGLYSRDIACRIWWGY